MRNPEATEHTKRLSGILMTITDAAADRLRRLYENAHQGKFLRIGVKAKGCSGMSYDLTWAEQPTEADEIMNYQDITILVDRKASLFLFGTVMDYSVNGLSSGFIFLNPNEKARCGCGESFSV